MLAAGRLKQATRCFAHAYQLRCLCDWVHVLGNKGDFNHARFLQASRKFSKYTSGAQLSAVEEDEGDQGAACHAVIPDIPGADDTVLMDETSNPHHAVCM